MDSIQWLTEDAQTIDPRTPGEFLRREMTQRGLTATSLSATLGVHPQTIYNVTGKEPRRISSRLALLLAKHLGQDVDFWLSETLSVGATEEARTEPTWRPSHPTFVEGTASLRSEQPPKPGLMVDSQLARALSDRDSGLGVRSPSEIHIRPASIDLTVGLIVVRGYEYLTRDILTLVAKYQLFPEDLSPTERDSAEAAIEFYSAEVDFRNSYILGPGQSVIIISREDLSFGDRYAGRVGQSTSLALNGCQVLHGLQIDPGFSGPLFARVVNCRDQYHISLNTGDVFLSVEVTNLSEKPSHPHQGTLGRKMARVAERVQIAIEGLFTYKSTDGGLIYKATFEGDFDKSFVAMNDENVQGMAIAWIVATLADASSIARPEVESKLIDVMDSIPIVQDEAEALLISLSCPREHIDQVMRHFGDGQAQTLADTARRMQRRPADIAMALLEHHSNR